MLDKKSFTYSSPEYPFFQRALIKTIESVTGQIKIWRLYKEYQAEYLRTDETFWEAAIRKLELTLTYDRERLQAVPKKGAVVIVANHPYGVLDGVIINQMISKVRKDYKVLTNSVLCKADEAKANLLEIDFSGTKEALETNLQTRKKAREILKEGGCIVVFPAGGVSTIPTWKDKVAQDTEWQPFIGRLIQESRATVVPFFFEGQNSRLFQLASLVSPTLRLSLFFKEVADKVGGTIGICIGKPILFEALASYKDRAELCHYLRTETYKLGGMNTLQPPKKAYRLETPFKEK